jgi:4-amino-4-deoxy-L-arabinose transferase-like glycosyltransferase
MPTKRSLALIFQTASSPWAIFLVAFGIRLVVIWQLLPAHAQTGFYEQNEPARIASNIVSGHGFSSPWPRTPLVPTAQQPPVYPYLLAAIFKSSGVFSATSLWIAVMVNALASALTAVLILKAGRITFGSTTALVAAWVWACSVYEAVVAVRLWPTGLSALFLMLSMSLTLKLARSSRVRYWVELGLLAGCSGLTNPALLSLFPFFWLWLWIGQPGRGRGNGRYVLLSVLIAAATLLPWTLRNYASLGRLVPVRDNFGMELWIGNHDGVTHLYDFRGGFPLLDPEEYNHLGEIGFMEAKRDIAMQFIRQHPGQFLRLSGQRFFDYWGSPDPGFWLVVSGLAWLGVFLMLRQKATGAVLYAFVFAVFPCVYYVTHTWSTYRNPMEPLMALTAIYLLERLGDRTLRRFEVWSRRNRRLGTSS